MLLALNLFVYARVSGFAFINWDDPTYITDNATVLSGLSWRTAWWALTTGHAPYWHPLTWLSHLTDVRLFGLDAGAHHLVNLGWHIANCVLVFVLVRSLTRALWPSAMLAAIFAVHPLHVESVAWIAERKDVLSTFFSLLTMLGYVAFVRRRLVRTYVLMAALFVLALMSKPMVVTLPVLLLCLDHWPLNRREPWRARVVEKLPLFALSALGAVTTFVIQMRVGAVAGLGALSWQSRVANAIVSYVLYVAMTIWPTRLAAFYPQHPWPILVVAGCASLLVIVTAAAWRARQHAPYLIAGWIWFLVSVLPVIGLLQSGEQAMADRFMYLAIVGLLFIAIWGTRDLLARVAVGSARNTMAAMAAIAVIAAGAMTSRVQAAYWIDSVTLWRHAIELMPANYLAYENLGQAQRERGDLEAAIASYERARALAPAGSPLYTAVIENAMGLVRLRQGRSIEARDLFFDAVTLNPEFAEASNNLGNVLASEQHPEEAARRFEDAIRARPDFVEALVGIGSIRLRLGQPAQAATHFTKAIAIEPNRAEAHNGLGSAFAMEGNLDGAMTEYESALRLKPDLVTAHYNIAVVLAKESKIAEAIQRLTTALEIDPDYQPARALLRNLGK